MPNRRWQDWVNLALGLWLLASPALLGYAGTPAAWNAYVASAAIVALAASAAHVPRVSAEVVNGLLGLWLVVSPFALGFTHMRSVALHTVLMGIMIGSFAVWGAFSNNIRYERWLRRYSA